MSKFKVGDMVTMTLDHPVYRGDNEDLTAGKIYKVVDHGTVYAKIVDDNGNRYTIYEEWWELATPQQGNEIELLKQYITDNWNVNREVPDSEINTTLNDIAKIFGLNITITKKVEVH